MGKNLKKEENSFPIEWTFRVIYMSRLKINY